MSSNLRWGNRRRRRSERGAIAVLFAVLVVMLFTVAALGVDIAQQVNRKHQVINQLDAASTAAAAKLGAENGTIAAAVDAAKTFYASNGEGTLDTSKIDFWCVVARELSNGSDPLDPAQVAPLQIPTAVQSGGVCNPDAVRVNEEEWLKSHYQDRPRAGGGQFDMTCSGALCAVPCALNATAGNGWTPGNSVANGQPIRCNTIRVGAEEDVPFSFAPVIGIDDGSTGSQISVACAGSCGSVAPNPMDVVVVADRTLSMTDPLGCTIYGSGGCRDYRSDLVAGINSMLEVMTPEQQYVALGALGPSDRTRSNSESNACNSSQKGLVYPSDDVGTAAKGSWIPLTFKKDYLGSADSNGHRSLNASSKLVQAVDCLDAIDTTRETRLVNTRTALASPLKAAARYLLGRPGDENNIGALGGSGRSGTIRKVIIFETDGEPFENETTSSSSALTLDNRTDIFSKYTDTTDSGPTTSGPTLGGVQNGTPKNLNPDPPAPADGQFPTYQATYKDSNNKNRNITYRYRTNTTTKTYTRLGTGGQKACENFKAVANMAKQAGVLVITIGYNLDTTTMCSGSNDVGSLPGASDTYGQPWISETSPDTAACRSGNGTQASPYVPKTSCNQNMTVTYTVPHTHTGWVAGTGAGDDSVTNVLASASGGPDVPTGASTGCTGSAQIAAENADEDLFFCAAQGQDLAPLFVTALSKVTSGVKLIKLPTE